MTSTASPRLFLVDVFAEKPYAGNQLAVVVGASDWPTPRMQAFAREMNFSETTFASAEVRDGAFDVRIFTPAQELPFAGHPTLGTAWVLHRFFGDGAAGAALTLRLGIGEVAVEMDGDDQINGIVGLVRMRPRAPVLGGVMDSQVMAAHLGLDPSAIDTAWPCQRVSIGIEFVIVPVRDLKSLRAARPGSLPPADDGGILGVFAFAPEPYEPGGDVAARMFFDAFGIREDPATGSASACLAAYLSAHRCLGSEKVRARIQQGYECGRPSCLYIGAEPRDGGVAVDVAGKVILVARGEVA